MKGMGVFKMRFVLFVLSLDYLYFRIYFTKIICVFSIWTKQK